ncbi:MAG: potassium transporter TrkA, partial [Candidatus Thioglobus sp.]
LLNPALDTVYENDDELIAITEDDDTFSLMLKSDYDIFNEKINVAIPKAQKKEHVLILGWNQRAAEIVNELNNYMANDSQITVLLVQNNAGSGLSENSFSSLNIAVNFEICDIGDRHVLEQLILSTYDHIIILARSDLLTEKDADSFTLVTLLQLNDIANLQGVNPSIVSEILDNRNRQLAESAGVDDFVISDRLISLALSQISENKNLEAVFGELLSDNGVEIYLNPASDYIELEEDYNFYTILAAAGRKNETAIGYNRPREKNKDGNGIVVSPEKGKKVKFIAGDQIIVLAQ